jgi:hypothetical protein
MTTADAGRLRARVRRIITRCFGSMVINVWIGGWGDKVVVEGFWQLFLSWVYGVNTG